MEVVDVVVQALTLTYSIVDAYQNAPKRRSRCKLMVDQIARLGNLVEEIKPSLPTPLTTQTKACFVELNECLKKAYRLMVKTSSSSTLKYVFLSSQINEDLSSVSSDIEACLRSLPLIQVAHSASVLAEVRSLQASFTEIGTQLQEQSSSTKEQHDLASEVVKILRSRKSAENQEGILDRLLSWLAERFDSDVETVKGEWQEMKKNFSSLSEQVERSASCKTQVENELLQQIILCIDELDTGKFDDHSSIPAELTCGICLGLIKLPVVLASGHSFCRACIEESFSRGLTVCPISRQPVGSELVNNVALRGAVSRWKHARAMEEASRPAPAGERVYEAEFVQSAVDELQSESPIKLLKTLNHLVEVARSAGGAALIFQSGGVSSLSKHLHSQNKKVVEKVAGVLALLTSPRVSRSSYEDTGQAIFELCIERLLSLMIRGTGTTRLKAAETVTNFLHVSEVGECILSQPGVIRALATLALEFDDSGMEIGLTGLACLSGNRSDVHYEGAESVVSYLVDLLKSEEEHVIEESVTTLRSCMSSRALPDVCNVLRAKRAVPYLVRCAAGDNTPIQEAAVVILEHFSRHEGFDELVAAGFTKQVACLVWTLHAPGAVFSPVLRLAKGCLDSQQDWSSDLDELHSCIPRLMEILRVRACTADGLALLKTLCMRDSTCKELVLDNGGLELLQELVGSSLSTCRRGALSLLGFLLQGASCQEEFAQRGGISTLCEVIGRDESVECLSDAVRALGLVTANSKLRKQALEPLSPDRLVSFLDEKYPAPCRESAGNITALLLAESTSATISKQSLKLLANVVQNKEASTTVRRKASKVLLLYVTTRGSEDVKVPGLLAEFIELSDGVGEAYRDMLQAFVSQLNRGNDIMQAGGIPLLLQAFAKLKYQRDAAASLRNLTSTVASSHEALLEAGFGRTAVEFLNSRSSECDVTCVSDVAAAVVSVFRGRKQEALFMAVAEAFTKLLLVTTDDGEVMRIAARSLERLLPMDKEYLTLLKKPHTVGSLVLLLETQPLEALELLNIATGDPLARKKLQEENGIPKLVDCLRTEDHRVQELASSILINLGEPSETISAKQLEDIRCSMIGSGIKDQLLRILHETAEGSPVINAACLIANLNTSGHDLVFADEKVFTVLLNVLRFYMNNASTEGYTQRLEYIFQALKTFRCDKRFKLLMARNSLPGLILQSLDRDYGESSEVIKHSALSLVTSLLEETTLSKDISNMILANSVPALRTILIQSGSNKCKRLSAGILKHALKSGSGSSPQQACIALRDREFIIALLRIQLEVEDASKIIKLMKSLDRTSKYIISEVERTFVPWGNSSGRSE